MKKQFYSIFVIVVLTIVVNSCSTDSGSSYLIAGKDITGVVQKGPFINDTQINLIELTETFSQTGNVFTTEISNNIGSFEIKDVNLSSRYIQMTAAGFYFNEVKGEISAAPLTLNAFADVLNATTVNVNILTHLERPRIQKLIDDGRSYDEAVTQAKTEMLAIFGYESSDDGASEQIDITEDNERSAMLLAISVILQGDRSVGELSEILATIAADFAKNGNITDQTIVKNLRKTAADIDTEQVRENLINRYNDLGVSASIPNIESLLSSYLAVTASEPTITEIRASSITNKEGVLLAEVNANSARTEVNFELGKTEELNEEIEVEQSPVNGMRPEEIRADLTELEPNTTYYFRLKAVNSEGTTYSPVHSFTTLEEFPLTIYAEGDGEVTHEVISAKSIDYMVGTVVELTASAEEGWQFSHWKGSIEGNENPIQFEIDNDKEVTAVFERDYFSMDLQIEGDGAVDITLKSGKQEGNRFEYGSVVELAAKADNGWEFNGWSGDLEVMVNPQTVTINSEKSVTANFERKDYPLTVSIEGEGTVSEEVIQAKTTDYPYETNVRLTASALEGWVFSRWEGDATGSENPVVVEVTNDKTVTAVFERDTFEITYTLNGEGQVTETLSTGTQAEDGSYEYESTVELTAVAADGWEFTSWEGDLDGTENPVTVEIGSENYISAIFSRQEFTLSISTKGNGTVSELLLSGTRTEGGYLYESEVDLEAEPAVGWELSQWQGDISDDHNTIVKLIMDSDKSVTTEFKESVYKVDISIIGSGAYDINLISGTEKDGGYLYGSEIEVTTHPDIEWKFVHWDGDFEGTDNSYIFTIESDIEASAHLDDSPFSGGNGSEMYPYQVSTVEQLQTIKNYLSSHFIQINDIDAGETKNWNNGEGFKPIGDNSLRFNGDYDGNNTVIQDLYINRPNEIDIGLFGITQHAVIRNLTLLNINFSSARVVGGAIGFAAASDLENTYVTGTVNARSTIGLLVGYSENTNISQSYGAGHAQTNSNVSGGTVGYLGGLVGENAGGSISQSAANVNVSGGEESIQVGGVAGYNIGTIINSYAIGDVNGDSEVGGLIGLNSSRGQVLNSFAAGKVSGINDIGGIIGLNGATMESSYWDADSTEQSNGVGRGSTSGTTGLSTSQMNGSSAKENMPEFDWVNIWKTTNGYPILRWQE